MLDDDADEWCIIQCERNKCARCAFGRAYSYVCAGSPLLPSLCANKVNVSPVNHLGLGQTCAARRVSALLSANARLLTLATTFPFIHPKGTGP